MKDKYTSEESFRGGSYELVRPLKRRRYKLAFIFLLIFLSSFEIVAKDPVCDCEKIKQTGECSNPNCITLCGFQTSLEEISSNLAKKCLGEDNLIFSFSKTNVSAKDIKNVSATAKQKIEMIEKSSKNNLIENCPQCDLDSEISAHYKVVSPEKNCPEPYLKDYHYKNVIKQDKKNGACEEDKIFSQFGLYVKDLVSGGSEVSKKLWKACPDPCSFDVSYVTKIDEVKCEGAVNVKIGCTHRVRKSFWGIPIYNVQIDYKGGLQCKESA